MLTPEQTEAHDTVIDWMKINSCNHIVIGGYAGTGKTFLCSQINETIKEEYKQKRKKIAFVSFTGKAASILKMKLTQESQISVYDYIGTIHSLIYKPKYRYSIELKKYVFHGWSKVDDLDFDLIIIDEASMVSKEIWDDLSKYKIPIIAIGDHGQLPPIGDKSFNLMTNLDFELKEIHRQAENSPVLALSKFVRKNGFIPMGMHSRRSQNSFKMSWNDPRCQKIYNNIDFSASGIINLCGFNETRMNINNMIRSKLKFNTKYPYTDERLICLKNNRTTKIMNGQLGTLIWMIPKSKKTYQMTIELDGFEDDYYEGTVHECCFGKKTYEEIYKKRDKKDKKGKKIKESFDDVDYFDYGYCISVHKSQGSEFNKVVLFEQRTRHWDDEYYTKWLYTAVTRASDKLMVITDYY